MSDQPNNPWLHRWAVITVLVSLLPVTMGALTTTLDAGMAFNDWPTSDGHNMLTYPWFRSYGDKFVEHGHRLGGMLIGFVTLILVGASLRQPRTGYRLGAIAVLVAVITQGLLGGGRVRLDERTLALIHGQFAAWVVSGMALFACWVSSRWQQPELGRSPERVGGSLPLIVMLPLVIVVQYTLGGLLRHKHTAMDEHLIFAFVVFLFAVIAVVALLRSGVPWLKSSAWQILGLIGLQLALGAGAWITRFGFTPTGYVATARSLEQTWMRTSHTIVGMLLFAASVIAVGRAARVAALVGRSEVVPQVTHGSVAPGGLS